MLLESWKVEREKSLGICEPTALNDPVTNTEIKTLPKTKDENQDLWVYSVPHLCLCSYMKIYA